MGAFRVLLTVQVKPGLEADFEREWLAGRDIIAGHPANRGHWLCRGTTDATTYYVTSDWVDEPNFREFEKSEAHLVHRRTLHPYRTGGAIATMTVVAGEGARQPGDRTALREGVGR